MRAFRWTGEDVEPVEWSGEVELLAEYMGPVVPLHLSIPTSIGTRTRMYVGHVIRTHAEKVLLYLPTGEAVCEEMLIALAKTI